MSAIECYGTVKEDTRSIGTNTGVEHAIHSVLTVTVTIKLCLIFISILRDLYGHWYSYNPLLSFLIIRTIN